MKTRKLTIVVPEKNNLPTLFRSSQKTPPSDFNRNPPQKPPEAKMIETLAYKPDPPVEEDSPSCPELIRNIFDRIMS